MPFLTEPSRTRQPFCVGLLLMSSPIQQADPARFLTSWKLFPKRFPSKAHPRCPPSGFERELDSSDIPSQSCAPGWGRSPLLKDSQPRSYHAMLRTDIAHDKGLSRLPECPPQAPYHPDCMPAPRLPML